MFDTLQTTNCSVFGSTLVENCGFSEFCCYAGCCTDFTYYIIILIVVSMIVTVAIFIHVEIIKDKKFREKVRQHRENTKFYKDTDSVESRIQLGSSPIECPFNLPPSCSPEMVIPKLKLHKKKPIRQFLDDHF